MSAPLQSALKSLVDKLNAHGGNPMAFAVYPKEPRIGDPKEEILKVHFNPQFEDLGLRKVVPSECEGFPVEIAPYWPINAH